MIQVRWLLHSELFLVYPNKKGLQILEIFSLGRSFVDFEMFLDSGEEMWKSVSGSERYFLFIVLKTLSLGNKNRSKIN